MTDIDIKINTRKLSDYSASLKSTIDEETLSLMMKYFAQYVLDLYARLIEEAIYSKRYKGKWEPKDEEGYREYLGVEPTDNIIVNIRESLEIRKIGYNLIVRINPRYRYPGSKIPLVRVLRAIENGTSDFNARPILRSIVRKITYHILDLWRGFLKKKGVI